MKKFITFTVLLSITVVGKAFALDINESLKGISSKLTVAAFKSAIAVATPGIGIPVASAITVANGLKSVSGITNYFSGNKSLATPAFNNSVKASDNISVGIKNNGTVTNITPTNNIAPGIQKNIVTSDLSSATFVSVEKSDKNVEPVISKNVIIPTSEYLTPGQLRGMNQRGEVQTGDSRYYDRNSLNTQQKAEFDYVKNNPYKYEVAQASVGVAKPQTVVVIPTREYLTPGQQRTMEANNQVQKGISYVTTAKDLNTQQAGVYNNIISTQTSSFIQNTQKAVGSGVVTVMSVGNQVFNGLTKINTTYGGLPLFQLNGTTSTNAMKFNQSEMQSKFGVKVGQEGAWVNGYGDFRTR